MHTRLPTKPLFSQTFVGGVLIAVIAALIVWAFTRAVERPSEQVRPTSNPAPVPSTTGRGSSGEPTERTPGFEPARNERALLHRYLNPVHAKQEGRLEVAILPTEAPLPGNIEASLTEALGKQGAESIQSLFKPAFAADGMARALAAGDWSSLSTLRLVERVDALLLVDHKFDVKLSQQFEGLSSASITLKLVCVQVAHSRGCGSKIVTARGVGFSESAALHDAAEKSLPELRAALQEMRF